MKNVKILAACSLLLLGVSSCDLTGLNENPNKPSNDVDYNMNEPRLLGTVQPTMFRTMGGTWLSGNNTSNSSLP